MIHSHATFEDSLEREARLFSAQRNDNGELEQASYLVFDCEYLYDRERHAAYITAEGKDARDKDAGGKVRWPFHHLSAVSWLTFRYAPGRQVPEVTCPVVLTADKVDERAMVAALFDALRAAEPCRLVTWGGEVRDFAVLRHLACQYDLLLPQQLRDTSPHSRERLDLCRATAVQADCVHLQEYAAASSIPAKPSPPREIGALAEAGEWGRVREHVLADVLTTSVIALRHLASNGAIVCDRAASVVALADAAAAGAPNSRFVANTIQPWARDCLRAAHPVGQICPTG